MLTESELKRLKISTGRSPRLLRPHQLWLSPGRGVVEASGSSGRVKEKPTDQEEKHLTPDFEHNSLLFFNS